jgi:hypothetical protein
VVAAARRHAGGLAPRAAGRRRARRRRWSELLRLVFAVDVEVCPRCGGAACIVGFVTEPPVPRRILAHLERRRIDPRAGPWAEAPAPG